MTMSLTKSTKQVVLKPFLSVDFTLKCDESKRKGGEGDTAGHGAGTWGSRQPVDLVACGELEESSSKGQTPHRHTASSLLAWWGPLGKRVLPEVQVRGTSAWVDPKPERAKPV